jgi:hypothetical protein
MAFNGNRNAAVNSELEVRVEGDENKAQLSGIIDLQLAQVERER